MTLLETYSEDNKHIEKSFKDEQITGICLASKEFHDCHFRNIRFDEVDFYKSSFINCIFIDCSFDNCYFYSSNYEDVRIHGCMFDKCDFRTLKFDEARICNSSFLKNKVFEFNAHDTYFNNVRFQIDAPSSDPYYLYNCDLYNCDFSDSDLEHFSLYNRTRIYQCNFLNSQLDYARLEVVHISRSSFIKVIDGDTSANDKRTIYLNMRKNENGEWYAHVYNGRWSAYKGDTIDKFEQAVIDKYGDDHPYHRVEIPDMRNWEREMIRQLTESEK